jgi:hypothetical protein
MGSSHPVSAGFIVVASLLAAMPGCNSAADEACLGQFSSAQAVVMKVEPEDLASVSASVAAVEAARETCRAAGRTGEVEELDKAHTQLTAHRDRLVRRNELRDKQRDIAPEELARLVDRGDPSCPKGQGYLHARSGKRIVCVGPQPVDMTRAQAEQYFRGRGYRRQPESNDAELRFEYGAELVVLRYEGDGAPRCVILYPPPDRSWQEMTARLTGVAPARLKPNQPIVRAGRAVPFTLEESPRKVVAQIGSCG